jgi:Cu2+-exporting ATPase
MRTGLSVLSDGTFPLRDPPGWVEMDSGSSATSGQLATANVGIAIGAGTEVAIESAGTVLVRSDPRDVVGAIELPRATYRKMIQNLVCTTAYNLVAIPVAGGLFEYWGFDPPMSMGALAMSLSTIIVAANAQVLRRPKLQCKTL